MNEIDAALYTTLTGGTALTALLAGTTAVYQGQAPDGAAYPYIVFNLQAGGDENLTPKRTKNVLYQVRAFVKTPDLMAKAKAIDAAADALLHGKTLTLTGGWTNIWTARETDVQQTETLANGVEVNSSGALYRIRLSS